MMDKAAEQADNYYSQKRKSNGAIFLSFLVSNFGLGFIVMGYACLGAYVFVELERPAELEAYEDKKLAADDVDELIKFTTNNFWVFKEETNNTAYRQNFEYRLKMLEQYIIDKVNSNSYDGSREGWSDSWYFLNSLLLTITVMTTIGYGHISPSTYWGQMFCIGYAMIGVPLTLVFLANIGDSMANSLVYIYSRFACRWCRSRRYYSELPPEASMKQMKLLIDDDVGKEQYMPTSKVQIPITLCLVILSFCIMFGGVYFSSMENWPWSSACYFTFITISTIGYGDYVPGKSFKGKTLTTGQIINLLITVGYILVGMALLSMCINLMQEQLVSKCRWLANEVGLTKSEEITNIKQDKNIEKKKENEKSLKELELGDIEDVNAELPGILDGK